MCIETSQTFYDSGRDAEPSARAFVLLHLHPWRGEKKHTAVECELTPLS